MEEGVADLLLGGGVPEFLRVGVGLLARRRRGEEGDPRESDGKEKEPDQGEPSPAVVFALSSEAGFDLVKEEAHGGEAVFALGGEAALEERAQPFGDRESFGAADLLDLEVGLGASFERMPEERAFAVESFVEGDAKGELIGAFVAFLSVELFGSHVGGGSHDLPGFGERDIEIEEFVVVGDLVVVSAGGGGEVVVAGLSEATACEAKVDDAKGAVFALEDICGFKVAVDEAGFMGGLESASGLKEGLKDFLEGVGLLHPLFERFSRDEFHRDKVLSAKAARVVDLDDVGVREASHGAGFSLDADFGFGGVLVMMEVDAQELDGEFAVKFGIVGGVDGADGAA